jgi:acetate---CoA ligase (ADP-forming)
MRTESGLVPLEEVRESVAVLLYEVQLSALVSASEHLDNRRCSDVEALVSAIVNFAAMAVALEERIVEAEINPMFVLPSGAGVRAADAVAVLASAQASEG